MNYIFSLNGANMEKETKVYFIIIIVLSVISLLLSSYSFFEVNKIEQKVNESYYFEEANEHEYQIFEKIEEIKPYIQEKFLSKNPELVYESLSSSGKNDDLGPGIYEPEKPIDFDYKKLEPIQIAESQFSNETCFQYVEEPF